MSKGAIFVHKIIGKICSVIGYTWGLVSLAFIIAIVAEFDPSDKLGYQALLLMVVMLLVCIGFIAIGIRIKSRQWRYKKYVELISINNITSFKGLAAATKKTTAFVQNDLKAMIRMKYFQYASINHTDGEIVFSRALDGVDITGLDLESVTCGGCGALITKRRGVATHCEYCGSAIV